MEGMPYPPSKLSHSQPDLRRNQEKDSGLKQLLFSSQNEAPREAGLGLAQVNVGNGLCSWQGAPGPRQLAPGRKRAWPVWPGRCERRRKVRCGDRQEDFGVRHPHSDLPLPGAGQRRAGCQRPHPPWTRAGLRSLQLQGCFLRGLNPQCQQSFLLCCSQPSGSKPLCEAVRLRCACVCWPCGQGQIHATSEGGCKSPEHQGAERPCQETVCVGGGWPWLCSLDWSVVSLPRSCLKSPGAFWGLLAGLYVPPLSLSPAVGAGTLPALLQAKDPV